MPGGNRMDKYSSINTLGLELENVDASAVVKGGLNGNRSQRRRALKSLGKAAKREEVVNKRYAEKTKLLHQEYQKKLDEKIMDGLTDDWKKSTALAALTLKRKYNWNKGRVQAFVGKMNEFHIELVKSGEYADIEKLLDEECDIQLEVVD